MNDKKPSVHSAPIQQESLRQMQGLFYLNRFGITETHYQVTVITTTMQIIQYMSVDDLKVHPDNPRTIKDDQFDILCDSIKSDPVYFETRPILCNKDMTIFAGNQRFLAAKHIGLKKVPVAIMDISPKRQRAIMLKDNHQNGEWDFEKLMKSFDIGELEVAGLDNELSRAWDDVLETEDDDLDIEKAAKEAAETKINRGDRFRLGRHTLACDDSTDGTTIKKILGKVRVDLINTDIPYNIGLDYSKGMGGRQAYGGKTNDKKTDAEYRIFVKKIMESGLGAAKPDCHIFFWHAEKYAGMVQELYKELGIGFKRLCFWLKDNMNPTPQVAFNRVTELCSYGCLGKPYLSDLVKNLSEVMNREIGSGNRLGDDIMDMLNIWLSKRLAGNSYLHPTSKPPTLYEKSLRRCSKVGGIVLDLTAGSGSLLIACEQLKRTAYLVEIEPVFCQVIINRYEKLTGIKAKKIN